MLPVELWDKYDDEWVHPGANNFAELAKLTLGAFLGSYVQRQVGQASELQRPRSGRGPSEQSDER